jgi:molybdenum cofactor cytidylyltransferase
MRTFSDTVRSDFLCCGILLAAGRGKRFDASGSQHKLLQGLTSGVSVLQQSAFTLQAALPHHLAVVSESDSGQQAQLRDLQFPFTICTDAHLGMAHSLVHAIRQLPAECDAVLIVLADMPFLQAKSLQALAQALQNGAQIVVPTHEGRKGNPVGFARMHFVELLTLRGDQGARDLLKRHALTEVTVVDEGIFKDIDVPQDLM